MKTYICRGCNIENPRRGIQYKNLYCSNKCQLEYQYQTFIKSWLEDETVHGSKRVKRYILERQNNKCAHCGITEHNSKPIVLELEHKDGNSDNNRPENLECLCPNCHSQTPTYKNRNKGNGRHARRVRYSLDKSY